MTVERGDSRVRNGAVMTSATGGGVVTSAVGAARFYRPYVPLFGGIFFCLLGVGASLATLPFYVLRQLHGNKVEVGVVIAAIAVAAVIGRPVAGRIADRRGYKLIMLSGAVICMLAGAAYFAARNVAVLTAVRVLHGVGEASVYTAGAAWLVTLCPPERRGRLFGLYGIHMWLGITLGALLGTVVMRTAGFGAVWGVCVAVAALGLLAIVPKQRPALPPRPTVSVNLRSFFPVSTLAPGAALSLASVGYAALAAFVALHMAARGVSNGIAAFNAFGVTYIGVRLVIGNLPDRHGASRVAFWSGLVEAVGLLLVAVAHNLAVAIAGGLVVGAGLSLLFPALALLVINRTAAAQQGAALGAFASFWDIGVALGGPIAGTIASLSGYPAIYYVMTGCAVASAVLSVSVARGELVPQGQRQP